LSTECQGQGTLHGHCLAWVELTPQVLQRLDNRTIFSDQISSILDTVIISSLEVSDHITSALSDNRPYVNVWRSDCNPEVEPVKCKENIISNMTVTQIHSHSDTCKKGKHGMKSYRLGFKRVTSLVTGPLEIELVEQLNNTAPRIIYWATKRLVLQYSDIFNEIGELQPNLVTLPEEDVPDA